MANMANSAAYKIRTGPFAGRMGVDVTLNKTLALADSGIVQNVIADAITLTLPATATQGEWPIVVGGIPVTNGPVGAVTGNKAQLVTVAPVAADQIQGGPDGAAVDNKSIFLAKATAKIGDFVTIQNTGETNGPLVKGFAGVWARTP